MARIRDLKTGQMFEGPDDAPVPQGYELVTSAPPAAASSADSGATGYLKRVGETAVESGKEIATFPYRVGRLVAGYDKPQSFEDVALLALGNAPLIMAGGGLANLAHLPKLAPVARVGTAFGLAKGRGEDTPTAVIEAAGAGIAEGAGGLASKALGGPGKALEAIRARIGRGPDGPVNLRLLDRLLTWWKDDPNAAAQLQRARVVARRLTELDPSGEAATIFREQVGKGARIPLTARRLAPVPPGLSQAARAITDDPLARAAADAAMSADPTPTVGAVVAGEAMNPARLIPRMLP